MNRKTLVSFRLTDQCRDALQECVDLLRTLDRAEKNSWRTRSRTEVIELAAQELLERLQKQIPLSVRLKFPATDE
jgi:hypothetical protein